MDKSIIKIALIVLAISLALLIGSMCLSIKYGGIMMRSSVNSSNQTDQNNETTNSSK